MKLQVPFIQLPLAFDAEALAQEIAALGEGAWKPHPQGFAGNSMLPLVAVEGDPANDAFAGAMAPTPELLRCPYFTAGVRQPRRDGRPQSADAPVRPAEVTRHADQGYYWTERVRVHIPVVTQPTVRFECENAAINMAAGECSIFDTWRQHRVLNDAVESRVHLVVDTVGGGRFWRSSTATRPHDAPKADWQNVQIAPKAGEVAAFACERVNVPAVMTPSETQRAPVPVVRRRRAACQPAAGAADRDALRRGSGRGCRSSSASARKRRARYGAALQRFIEHIRGPSQPLVLKNELRWFSALMTIVCKFAVSDAAQLPATAQRSGEIGDERVHAVVSRPNAIPR